MDTFKPEMPLIRQRIFTVPSSGCMVIFKISNFTYANFRWPTVRNSAICFT